MKTLKQLRQQINQIDTAIIKKIAARNRVVKKIGIVKSRLHIKTSDAVREKQLMQLYTRLCKQNQLSPVFVKRLFKMIFVQSKKLQRRN